MYVVLAFDVFCCIYHLWVVYVRRRHYVFYFFYCFLFHI